MKKGHTKIVCIIDESGSMGSIKNDAIGGFNTFIESQKKIEGSADVTVVYFNDKQHTAMDSLSLDNIANIDGDSYKPSGSTALLDAVGTTIDKVGLNLAALNDSDRPEKVLFCILTDGEENASREYSSDAIKTKIEHQRNKYNWEFIFLAANQDAFQAAANYGISSNYTAAFNSTGVGTRKAYLNMSDMASSYRTSI